MLKVWRLTFACFVEDIDPDQFPNASIGLGWDFTWFYTMKLFRINQTIKFGPSGNLYIFLGRKYLTLSVEYWVPKEKPSADY